jgi:tripartite-type tricarboxylate transporter receptor subunit TctC
VLGMKLLSLVYLLILSLAAADTSRASDFPSRPIRLIVPSSAGGPTDIIARRYADKLADRLGQRIIIENRAGGRTVGPGEAAAAPPDGYTLLFTVDAYITVNPALYPTLPYDPQKDLTPVAVVAALNNFVLAVHPSVAVRTVREYVDLARSKPKGMSAANAGSGSPAHLVTALFALKANVELLHVPYRGGNLAVSDLIGGHVPSMFAPAQNAVGPVKEGRLIPLAVTGRTRFGLLPDVPTFAEAGFPELDLNQGFWYGMLAPAATPRPIIEKVANAMLDIARSDEMKKSLAAIGIDAVALGPDEMRRTIVDDTARWAAVVKEAGIKVE